MNSRLTSPEESSSSFSPLVDEPRQDIECWQSQKSLFWNAILTYIENHPEGISEHQLLKHLREIRLFPERPLTDFLALFQCHFWVFHLLYLLRDQLRQDQAADLHISPLNIKVTAYVESHPQSQPNQLDPLRTYYLDLEHLISAEAADVNALMDGSFKRLAAQSEEEEALSVLGLDDSATWESIRTRYRQLAQQHHPDRGGDPERFQAIQAAIEVLKQCHSPLS